LQISLLTATLDQLSDQLSGFKFIQLTRVPVGYANNSLECADLSLRTILIITFTKKWVKWYNHRPFQANWITSFTAEPVKTCALYH